MNKKLLITLCSIILFSGFAFSQSILNMTPSSVAPGDAVTVSIVGSGTHFKQGVSMLQFGNNSNITVTNIHVYSPSSMDAFVTFPSTGLTAGPLPVTVKTGAETTSPYSGFSIEGGAGSGTIVANLTVLPTQTIYVTDFDPGNAATAPIIFDVSVANYTGATINNYTATLTIQGASYGNILTATKTSAPMNSIAPNASITFTNRDFDNYQMNSNNQAFVNKAEQTGMVPADVYTYTITITNTAGKQVATASGINAITNPGAELYLISPGAPLTSSPEQISEANPLFQWFSQQTSYDIYIYPVNAGQTTATDITNNPPVYYSKGLTATSINYPLSAVPLSQGVTYAWQVIAHSPGSHGDLLQPSPVYWFSMGAPSNATAGSITSIVVQPGDIEIDMNDTFQFTATAYDNKENVVNMKPQWSVVPANGGTINQNGVFIAGNQPMTVAVVATYGNQEEYSTVQINLGGLPWDFAAFFQQIFGLPASSSK